MVGIKSGRLFLALFRDFAFFILILQKKANGNRFKTEIRKICLSRATCQTRTYQFKLKKE